MGVVGTEVLVRTVPVRVDDADNRLLRSDRVLRPTKKELSAESKMD